MQGVPNARAQIPMDRLRRSKCPRKASHSSLVGVRYSSLGRSARRRAMNARQPGPVIARTRARGTGIPSLLPGGPREGLQPLQGLASSADPGSVLSHVRRPQRRLLQTSQDVGSRACSGRPVILRRSGREAQSDGFQCLPGQAQGCGRCDMRRDGHGLRRCHQAVPKRLLRDSGL